MSGRRLLVLTTLLLTMGCVAPGGVGKPTPTNPITAGEIATTSLDSPANQPAVSMPKPKPRPQNGKSGLSKPEIVKPEPGKPEPGEPEPGKAGPPKTGTPTTEPANPAPPPLTAEGRACLKKGGLWGKAGIGLGDSCVMRTRDSGKSCHRASQCDGVCLARSQTCAPYKPLFGCNAILQDNGLEVTLCID